MRNFTPMREPEVFYKSQNFDDMRYILRNRTQKIDLKSKAWLEFCGIESEVPISKDDLLLNFEATLSYRKDELARDFFTKNTVIQTILCEINKSDDDQKRIDLLYKVTKLSSAYRCNVFCKTYLISYFDPNNSNDQNIILSVIDKIQKVANERGGHKDISNTKIILALRGRLGQTMLPNNDAPAIYHPLHPVQASFPIVQISGNVSSNNQTKPMRYSWFHGASQAGTSNWPQSMSTPYTISENSSVQQNSSVWNLMPNPRDNSLNLILTSNSHERSSLGQGATNQNSHKRTFDEAMNITPDEYQKILEKDIKSRAETMKRIAASRPFFFTYEQPSRSDNHRTVSSNDVQLETREPFASHNNNENSHHYYENPLYANTSTIDTFNRGAQNNYGRFFDNSIDDLEIENLNHVQAYGANSFEQK